jgi:ABC-type branched-subunit amino acid transport system substrate-binding protein
MKKLLPWFSAGAWPCHDGRPRRAGGDEYVIGCPQPLTGTNAQPGEMRAQRRQAGRQADQRGGRHSGKQIRLVSYDDQGPRKRP